MMTDNVIIQAQAGWFQLCVDDSGQLGLKCPVVAFEIVKNKDSIVVNPITLMGRVKDAGNGVYMMRPDGVVDQLGSQTWIDINAANELTQCEQRLELNRNTDNVR